MATTTNYGWTTPDDTALVKDGAAAIRTLGSSVDTTTKALNPSTTLGDIEYRSSTANTNTRLGIGTSGQVLSVTGGVPAWSTISAGSLTLLSTTTLSGASVTVSSIDQTYQHLYLVAFGLTNATANGSFFLEPNANTTSAQVTYLQGATLGSDIATNLYWSVNQSDIDRTDSANTFTALIENYTNTNVRKSFKTQSYFKASLDGLFKNGNTFGHFNITSAISSIRVKINNGDLSTGTLLIYGVK
jgi:hypothetical protein